MVSFFSVSATSPLSRDLSWHNDWWWWLNVPWGGRGWRWWGAWLRGAAGNSSIIQATNNNSMSGPTHGDSCYVAAPCCFLLLLAAPCCFLLLCVLRLMSLNTAATVPVCFSCCSSLCCPCCCYCCSLCDSFSLNILILFFFLSVD